MYPDGEHEFEWLEDDEWQRRAEEDAGALLMEMAQREEEGDAPDCPFCRHLVDVLTDGRYVCGNCEVTWLSRDELDADYVEPPDADWCNEIESGYWRDVAGSLRR